MDARVPFIPDTSETASDTPDYTAAEAGLVDEQVVRQLSTLIESSVTDEHREADKRLIAELREKTPPRFLGETDQGLQTFANKEIAERARPTYTADQLKDFRQMLTEKGTLDLQLIWQEVTVEGTKRLLPFMPATELNPNHGDMCRQIYVRDQVMAARAAMHRYLLDPERYAADGELGRMLLSSTLHLMSTPDQLARCNMVVALGPKAEQKDWPFISVRRDDMDSTAADNRWRNIQNSLQMLGDLTCEALAFDFISPAGLTRSNRQLLSAIPSMLAAVGFPRYGNSGSWEEVTGDRSSVMSPETALSAKMLYLLSSDRVGSMDFLQATYAEQLSEGAPVQRRADNTPAQLAALVTALTGKGLTEFGRRLPYESPHYDPTSIKYRKADAALADVLLYNIPELMEQHQIPIVHADNKVLSAGVLRGLIVDQVRSLMDPATGGMWRYGERTPDGVTGRDSYLGPEYMLPGTQVQIVGIKDRVTDQANQLGTAPDLDLKQRLRNEVVKPGRQAAWAHPVGQVGTEEAKQYFRAAEQGRPEEARQHLENAFHFFNQMLRTITGEGEHTVALQADGGSAVQPVPAFRVPEARVPYSDDQGDFDVPSPHSPLYWAVETLNEFLAYLEAAARHAEATAVKANHGIGEVTLRVA